MTKKRCATCKYWDRNNRVWRAPYGGNCSCDKFVYTDDDELMPVDGLSYWDYESYSAGFETGEQFGCIHWCKPDCSQ